jgi:hypothetical protein
LSVLDTPENGKTTEVTEKICVSPGRQHRLCISVPVDGIGKRTAEVRLKEYYSKGVLESRVLPAELSPIKAFFSRNYYTSEEYAELSCVIALPPESLSAVKL